MIAFIFILFVSFATSQKAAASRVYGQGNSFTSATSNLGGVSASSLNQPRGIAADTAAGVYISDYANHRVLYYQTAGATTAVRVYGQFGSFVSSTPNLGAISGYTLNFPYGLRVTSAGLYVADSRNNRVLFYPNTTTLATIAYGQANVNVFDSTGIVSASTLNFPYDVQPDSLTGGLYVADTGNCRLLYYPSGSTTATRVYGQPDFTTRTPPGHGLPASRTNFQNVYSIAIDSTGRLYAVDQGYNRILSFPPGSTIPDRVFGQEGSFTTGYVNNPRLSSKGFNYPASIAVDTSNNLFVCDWSNQRMLFFPSSLLTSSTSSFATGLYGQTSFDVNITYSTVGPDTVGSCGGITTDSSGNLYLAEWGNNRALFYTASSTTTQVPTSRPATAAGPIFDAILVVIFGIVIIFFSF